MTGLLQDKVVIVAGLGGIGNGLARRFAEEGARPGVSGVIWRGECPLGPNRLIARMWCE